HGQLGDALAVVGADVNSAAGFNEVEMEIRRARQRLRRGEAGSQRMLHHPPQGSSVPGGGLALELRGVTRPAGIRAHEILLRLERRRARERRRQKQGFDLVPQYSNFSANWISRGALTWLVTTPNCGLPNVNPGFPKRTRLNTLKNSLRNCKFIRPSLKNRLFLTSPKSMLFVP